MLIIIFDTVKIWNLNLKFYFFFLFLHIFNTWTQNYTNHILRTHKMTQTPVKHPPKTDFFSCRRARPTLKPSQNIIKDAQQFVDIYKFPPTRPEPLYPQPVPDKTAAKCRKDVCLLPDCYCGGKDIPGKVLLFHFLNL